MINLKVVKLYIIDLTIFQQVEIKFGKKKKVEIIDPDVLKFHQLNFNTNF
jgi:hypothetical protein